MIFVMGETNLEGTDKQFHPADSHNYDIFQTLVTFSGHTYYHTLTIMGDLTSLEVELEPLLHNLQKL